MEDLFEVLVVVIVAVIGGLAKSRKNKEKKKAAASPAQVVEPVTKPARPITEAQKAISRSNIESAVKMFSELAELADEPKKNVQPTVKPSAPANQTVKATEATSIEAELKRAAQPAKTKRKKKPKSGESVVDEHGCLGGSMPVHNAEGESPAEHAAHKARMQPQTDAYALRAETLKRPSAQELRRAVVMSEVLDKPVSLRGRRY